MAWKADNVRSVLFPAGAPAEVLDLWNLLGLGAPDQYQKRIAATGVGHAAGGGAILIVQPGRVELRLQKIDPEEGPQLSDAPDQELTKLRALAAKLLDGIEVTRLACCADLLEPQDSMEAANKLFADAFAGFNLSPSAQDVLFQVNVRRPCNAAPVQMNRVCKWGSATQQLIQVEVAPTAGQQMLLSERVVSTFSADVNTAPQSGPYTKDVAKLLFEELAAETLALMHNGYGQLTR